MVTQNVAWSHRMSHGHTECRMVTQNVAWSHRMSHGHTECRISSKLNKKIMKSKFAFAQSERIENC